MDVRCYIHIYIITTCATAGIIGIIENASAVNIYVTIIIKAHTIQCNLMVA